MRQSRAGRRFGSIFYNAPNGFTAPRSRKERFMADGHLGPRAATSWPITRLFTAFRIALDLKKLALAGAGIVVAWFGWWLLCLLFYRSDVPQWAQYTGQDNSEAASWKRFKLERERWNLLHRLA